MLDNISEITRNMRARQRRESEILPAPHWHYLEGFHRHIGEPFEVREAKARSHFLANAPIAIHPGEAIAGQLDWWNEPFATTVSCTHIRAGVAERIAGSGLPQAERDRVASMLDAVRPYCFDPVGSGILTEPELLAHESALAPSTFFNGHMVPAFDYLLSAGLDGILRDIRTCRNRELTKEKQDFYDAMEITVRGISAWFLRHSELAGQLLRDLPEGYDPETLKAVRRNCAHLAHGPASTYPEALQLVWFFMVLTDYDSFGRADQYLYPYFRASLDAGMDAGEAMMWTKHMLVKAEECGAILNMTVCGALSDGRDASNGLSMLLLRAVRENGFRSPNLSLRIAADSPTGLWEEAHRSLAGGQGLPALYNDAVIVPMLTDMGFAIEDARDYCLAGCSQVVLPGRSNFACDVGCYNLLKALELALRDGRDGMTGKQVGPRTGRPEDLDTWDKLKAAYDAQMRYMTGVGASINNKDVVLRGREGACVRSLVNHDCIARGQGFFHGGARHNAVQNEACGITNAADSLHALKQFVFEEKRMSLRDLVAVLDRDWEGAESLRLILQNRYDKFGNDSPEVDAIRAGIAADWYAEMQKHKGELGGVHWPGEVVFIYHELHGAKTAASPDGRRKGAPLASSAGASSGLDLKGPTALLNSMLKIPQRQCRTCCVLNIAFQKRLWSENRDTTIALFRSYFAHGGFQLQVNVTDREALRKAKADPAGHAGLVVRVGGFSDYFCRLNPALQDEIISRTEF